VPNKTQPNDAVVESFLSAIKTERRRQDASEVLQMMRAVSGEPGRMWGASIVGFGVHRYPLAGGKSGEICKIGFAPRANATVLYLGEFPEREDGLSRLGKHKTGVGCIYVSRLDAVDKNVLRELVENSWKRPDE
jgi:hypothetical protein